MWILDNSNITKLHSHGFNLDGDFSESFRKQRKYRKKIRHCVTSNWCIPYFLLKFEKTVKKERHSKIDLTLWVLPCLRLFCRGSSPLWGWWPCKVLVLASAGRRRGRWAHRESGRTYCQGERGSSLDLKVKILESLFERLKVLNVLSAYVCRTLRWLGVMSSKPKLRLEIKTIKKCKQEELQKFECHIALRTSFYHPQRSWGKLIFSEACVKNSVHGGGGHAWQGGLHGRGGIHGSGAYMEGEGACMVGGMHGKGGHAWQGGACVAGGGVCGGGRAWQILWDTVNERAVRILLECILVTFHFNNFLAVEKVTING